MGKIRIGNFAKMSAVGALIFVGLTAMEDGGFPYSPALPPPLGRVDISADDADPVQVYVDGELMTDRTPAIITVPAGEVMLLLKKTGYADREETVSVEPLQTITLRAEMMPQ